MWLDACFPWWKLRYYLNARLGPEALHRQRQRRFAALAAYVAEHSPYYAQIMRQRRIDPRRATPADFPVLTKTALLENFDQIVTTPEVRRKRLEEFLGRSRNPADLMDGRYVVVHSSGTSGRLVICAYTLQEWVRGWVKLFQATPFWGPFPRRSAYVGATDGHFTTATYVQTARWLTYGFLYRTRLFDINLPWRQIVDGLNAWRPHVLVCYGSLLGPLVTEQERGTLRIKPRAIMCGGDALPPPDRRRAQRVYGATLGEIYAATECQIIGLAEPRSEGMALQEDDLWIDLGENQLLVTYLGNRTTPLIRYAIADTVVPSPRREFAHYRGFRRIESMAVRQEDNLILCNESGQEDFIHALLIVEFYVSGIDRFQVRRTSRTSFVFRVRPVPGLTRAEQCDVVQRVTARWNMLLTQKNMRNVRFTVELTDDMPHDPRTGKFHLVVGA